MRTPVLAPHKYSLDSVCYSLLRARVAFGLMFGLMLDNLGLGIALSAASGLIGM